MKSVYEAGVKLPVQLVGWLVTPAMKGCIKPTHALRQALGGAVTAGLAEQNRLA
ncbi:MAG: hypothetical protein AAF974_04305 [Cyanobacteria bacterium P01_E01_bin.34]